MAAALLRCILLPPLGPLLCRLQACRARGRHPPQAPSLTLQAQAAAPAGGEAKKLWGGRFTGATDPLMEKFNESLPFDRRMWAEDIRVRSPRQRPVGWHLLAGWLVQGSAGAVRMERRRAAQAAALRAGRRPRLPPPHGPPDPLPTVRMQGSQAYAKALAKAGVLTEEEAAQIVEGLAK